MPRRTAIALAASVALALVGCDAAPSRGAVIADTLPNGIVRVRNPDPRDAHLPSWAIVEERRIGAAEEEGPTNFSEIRSFTLDGAKRLYALDYMSQEIRVFDSLGAHLRTFARDGAGPGELQRANGLTWSNGRLWVNDVGNSRFDMFLEDGTFSRSFPRRLRSYSYSWWGGVGRDGRAYDQELASTEPIDRTPGLKRQVSASRLLRFDFAGRVDSLPLPPGETVFYRFPRGGTGVPFADESFAVFDPLGYVWLGTTGVYRIHQTRLGGDTVRIIERAYRPIPVSAGERARAIEGLERLESRMGPADLDYSGIPPVKPAIAALDPDDEGRLWVRPVTEARGTEFDVFDSTGTLMATATAGFRVWPHRRVTVRGTLLVTVVTDSLGVDRLVIARIRR